MSGNFQSAFDFIINLNGFSVTYERDAGDIVDTMRIAPFNYFRNLSSIEGINIEGKEYIISKTDLEASVLVDKTPQRGDALIDANTIGTNTITEVREMMAFGQILGYRVRTS